MKTGIILLSHGSRSPEAQVTVQELLEMVRGKSNYDFVAGAALQFNQPDLPAALAETVSAGVERIIVAPIFLYMGLHMKEDIPEILEEERKKYPGVDIVMTRNIGADKKLAEIVLDRIGEVV
ncbi:MAG: CbiX/SirB N-terminal domain-containing protein [Actinobacteria bacterium]|nr:CbiX/SirB N-terminal domain-containing protein [Actinomycetota bacterium]